MSWPRTIVVSVLALWIGVYGIHCWWQLGKYLGTNEYWTNVWFWKSHACLVLIIVLDAVVPKPEKTRP